MTTITNKFSPSQNIIYDHIDVTQYIVTSNVHTVFDLIASNFKAGVRSFSLIGAYGTGKSSFLSAFELHLNSQKIFIDQGHWHKFKQCDTLKILGEYDSLIDTVKKTIKSSKTKPAEILKDFGNYIQSNEKGKNGLLFIVDEFGKFLEYAATNNPERELYFIQQLAELINYSSREIIFLNTLHQDFASYSVNLNKGQRDEWVKVKGRFKELTFNEPVEQLIYLASKRLNNDIPEYLTENFKIIFKAIEQAKVFPLRDFFDIDIAAKIYPMDILSCAVLALALQQYGQNERSLFTFLDTENYLGLNDFSGLKSNFYSVAHIYNFLNYNLNSFLKSKANVDYSKWAAIRIALERVEGEFDLKKHGLYFTIIRTIGMLNIFQHAGSNLNAEFLVAYIENANKLTQVHEAIKELESAKIIRYNKYSHKYILFENTDVDIDVAIEEAGLQLNRSNDVITYLNKYFTFSKISAKRIFFQLGTPRLFEFKISEYPITSFQLSGEVDGVINLVFNDKALDKNKELISGKSNGAILYGIFKNTDEIKTHIEYIQKAEIARNKHLADSIVQRELAQMIDTNKNLLNHFVLGSFYKEDAVDWYDNGTSIQIENSKRFNARLSEIAQRTYTDTPTFLSELANRSKLSTPILTAKKALFKALINNYQQENIGLTHGYPPERTIYLSLLRETGIHRLEDEQWILQEPNQENDHFRFLPLFNASTQFMLSSIGIKRGINEFYESLSQTPFKLKKGFLDFWIPIFLFINRTDFALYSKNGFIPEIDEDILDLISKSPKDYYIKTFEVSAIRIQLFNEYRSLLNLSQITRSSNGTFIQTIVPFVKFFKELPDYTKQTSRLSKSSLKLRKAIIDTEDPERLFFIEFPEALGYDIVQLNNEPALIEQFIGTLQLGIKELRLAYDGLLDRFESVIGTLYKGNLDFLNYKDKLRSRYSNSIKEQLLLPYQQSFYKRLCSPLEDRSAWLSSIAQAVVGKTLDKITDHDEVLLHEKFIDYIHELDNLNDIVKQSVNFEEENVFKLEITSAESGSKQKIIHIPKDKNAAILAIQSQMAESLKNENKFSRIAILAELLKNELEND